MRGDVLGVERRRRWDDEVKLAVVSAVGVDDATVTQVAQRHDVTRQQIYAWRHELKPAIERRNAGWTPCIILAPARATPTNACPTLWRC
jgi:transposase-like protein